MIPCLSVLPLFIVVGKLSRTTPRSKWNRSCDCYPVPTNSLFIWASDSNIELGHPIVVVRAVKCSSRLFTLCCRGRLFFFFFFFWLLHLIYNLTHAVSRTSLYPLLRSA